MLIELRELNHRYRMQSELVINSLSHAFVPGTVTVLTGASGSGKSTLLYIAALLLRPSSGSVMWDGRNVHDLSDAEQSVLRARHVGFVFQDALLDPSASARDNVLEAAWLAGIPDEVSRHRADELMARFGVSERARSRPGEISGGQAQRIALCRALVKEPAVIFADEPTGNLDSDSADIVWSALRNAADEGATVIAATHDHVRAQAPALQVVLS